MRPFPPLASVADVSEQVVRHPDLLPLLRAPFYLERLGPLVPAFVVVVDASGGIENKPVIAERRWLSHASSNLNSSGAAEAMICLS